MDLEYEDFEEARIKHLELIQQVISRLGGNGFLIRGWGTAVAGAFIGLAVQADNALLALASLVPTISFWALDGYLLRAERLFRELYRRVAEGDQKIPPFYMSATSTDFVRQTNSSVASTWRTVFKRPILVGFYGGLVLAGLAVAVTVASVDDPGQSSDGSSTAMASLELRPQ